MHLKGLDLLQPAPSLLTLFSSLLCGDYIHEIELRNIDLAAHAESFQRYLRAGLEFPYSFSRTRFRAIGILPRSRSQLL